MGHNTGLEDCYILKNNKKMRFGYTTGSCAAAAAKAAAYMLFEQRVTNSVSLPTPKGILLQLEIRHPQIGKDWASCAVKKDAGDDPDMTDGLEVFARVEKSVTGGITIDGGTGVGCVTKPGLEQPVGSAAINSVPRAMIEKELEEICLKYGYEGGFFVEISVPGGETTAEKTFNPRLGIVGGISILGTSGIVEPMSESALIKSIEIEMRQQVKTGSRYLLVTPGNYGAAYLKEKGDLPFEKGIKCSNFVGETIDMAIDMGAEGILFVAHIGKFAKVAAGIMNTHSRCADGRAEIMAANALRAGISREPAMKILDTCTTDDALEVIKEAGVLQPFMEELTDRILFYLNHRAYGRLKLGAVLFSNAYGYLGETKTAKELIQILQNRE